MKGLLLKELLILRPYLKTYMLVMAAYLLVALKGTASMFASMISVILFVLPMSAFAQDEMARWDKFAAALPGGLRKAVNAKYHALLVLLAGALVLSLAADLLIALIRGWGVLPELTIASVSCVAGGLLFNCLLFPFLFKYGSQRGRVVMIAVFAVVFAMIALGVALIQSRSLTLPLLQQISLAPVAAIGAVLLAAALAISYAVSCHIYDKKEF